MFSTLNFCRKYVNFVIKIREKQNVKEDVSVKRNEHCPCGSGLKYKKCCGKN